MLFLPALLFFVLSTGTSALAAGSKKPDRFLTVPTFGLDDDMDYDRAQGYWRPEVRTKHSPFNVTSFEKLNLDRKRVRGGLLWHILATVIH